MQTYTIGELSKKAKTVCGQEEPVLITNNGRPCSLVFNISDLPINESISFAQELYGRFCIDQMQKQAAKAGLDSLPLDEINAEIAASRVGY